LGSAAVAKIPDSAAITFIQLVLLLPSGLSKAGGTFDDGPKT